MSDTPNETPQREGRSGTWTPEDLAELVTLSPQLLERATLDPMSHDDAVNYLTAIISGGEATYEGGRWTFTNGPHSSVAGFNAAKDLARTIVDGLPDEAMDRGVITSMDVRPYLDALAKNPDMKLRSKVRLGMDQSYPIGEGNGMWATKALGALQAQAEHKAREGGTALGLSTDGIKDTMADITLYESGTAGLSPTAQVGENLTTRSNDTAAGGGQAVDEDSSMFSYTPLQSKAMVDMASLRAAVASGDMQLADVQGVLDDAAKRTGETMSMGISTGNEWDYNPGQAPTPKQLNLPDALNYIFKIPESEVAEIQKKLAAAGYFDKLGEAGMYGYVQGDAWDGVTKDAWRLAMSDAFAQSKTIDQLLRDEGQTYRTTKQAEWEQNMPKLNDQALSMSANDVAQQLIGRNLSWEEQRELETFIEDLRSRPVQIAGEDTFGGRNQLDSETGFAQADVAEYLDSATKKEQQMMHTERLAYAVQRRFG